MKNGNVYSVITLWHNGVISVDCVRKVRGEYQSHVYKPTYKSWLRLSAVLAHHEPKYTGDAMPMKLYQFDGK